MNTEVTGAADHLYREDGAETARETKCWVTYAIITACVLVACADLIWAKLPGGLSVREFLAPSAFAIWAGAYWALVSTAFVHADFLHLFMNMYWLRIFGPLMESRFGSGRFAAFSVAAAILSAGAQLALSDQTGVGYSGVIYAYFGYMFAARRSDLVYAECVTSSRCRLFFGWLIVCVALTYAKILNIANAAHFAGLSVGLLAGLLNGPRKYLVLVRTGLALLTLTTLASLLYMPWSPPWRSRASYTPYLEAEGRARAGDPEGQFLYSVWCLQMLGNEVDGEFWLKKAVAQGHPQAMNNLAWRWATDPRSKVRRGNDALNLALKLCEQDGWKSAAFIDTLAACYAEADRWNEAVEFEKLALVTLPKEERDRVESYRESLRKYYHREKQRGPTS